MKFTIFLIICVSLNVAVYAQHQTIVDKYEYYERYQMVRLKHAAKTLRARSYIQNTPEPYGNLIDSTIEERYPGGNIKTLAFRNRGQTPVIKVKNYLNNNEHQLSTVLIPKTNKGKMTPVEEYYYGKSGLDSSKISLMDGGVETSVYERGTPLNILSSIRISSPDGYGKIKFDLEGKKIEDKRFRQNAGVISITDYIYDYKGNNIAINISDGEYHLKYRTENTFDDDNNLVFTKNTDGQTKYKYNNLKQKTEEISYQGDGRVKRKTFFDYNIDGSIARIISNDMERSFFITYNRFGQETENYFSESNGPITKVVTMHAGKFITGKKTIFQERVLSDTSYKYDAKKRVIEQTTYFEGSQIGDIEKTINRYDTGCPIPNQTLVYWGERLYSKTTFELTPACKIKSRKVSQPSGLYIVANDDPTPRGIDSYKPIYDLKKRLIEETYTNTLKGIIYHIKIKYVKDKIRQVTLNDRTLNFDKNSQLIFSTLNGKIENRYSYKYDKQGNWILMEVKENTFITNSDNKTATLTEIKSRFTEREITYY